MKDTIKVRSWAWLYWTLGTLVIMAVCWVAAYTYLSKNLPQPSTENSVLSAPTRHKPGASPELFVPGLSLVSQEEAPQWLAVSLVSKVQYNEGPSADIIMQEVSNCKGDLVVGTNTKIEHNDTYMALPLQLSQSYCFKKSDLTKLTMTQLKGPWLDGKDKYDFSFTGKSLDIEYAGKPYTLTTIAAEPCVSSLDCTGTVQVTLKNEATSIVELTVNIDAIPVKLTNAWSHQVKTATSAPVASTSPTSL